MFKVNEYVVYPGHGVGQVTGIETKEILGTKTKFYNVLIKDSGMKIVVPVENAKTAGLRPVVDAETAQKALKILDTPSKSLNSTTWNRRYREYMEMIKTGDLLQIAQVIADLKVLQVEKELSFGERKMLDCAKNFLLSEIDAVLDNAG